MKWKRSYQHDLCRGQRRSKSCADTFVRREIREGHEVSCIHFKYTCAIERRLGSDTKTRTASITRWIVRIQRCGGLCKEWNVQGMRMHEAFVQSVRHKLQRNPLKCSYERRKKYNELCGQQSVVSLSVGIHVGEKCVMKWELHVAKYTILPVPNACTEMYGIRELFPWKCEFVGHTPWVVHEYFSGLCTNTLVKSEILEEHELCCIQSICIHRSVPKVRE